jgi:hypothetical protein
MSHDTSYPPLAFDRAGALDYTGLAPKLFSELERAGSINPKRYGRNGGKLYLREELEGVMRALFGHEGPDIDDEISVLDR